MTLRCRGGLLPQNRNDGTGTCYYYMHLITLLVIGRRFSESDRSSSAEDTGGVSWSSKTSRCPRRDREADLVKVKSSQSQSRFNVISATCSTHTENQNN